MCLLGCCEPTVGVDERFDPKGGWMEHAKLREADLGKILAIAFDGGLYSGSGSEFRRVVRVMAQSCEIAQLDPQNNPTCVRTDMRNVRSWDLSRSGMWAYICSAGGKLTRKTLCA